MPSLSELATDERTARMARSMLVEPNDPVMGRILARLGAVEPLAERDGAVVRLAVDAQVWRARFSAPEAKDVAMSIAQVQQSDVRAPSRSSTRFGTGSAGPSRNRLRGARVHWLSGTADRCRSGPTWPPESALRREHTAESAGISFGHGKGGAMNHGTSTSSSRAPEPLRGVIGDRGWF